MVEHRWVRLAVWVCIAIAIFVAIAAFLLSFSALHSLALRAGVPDRLAWLWPLVVDVTIVQSTVALVALAQVGAPGKARAYFWALGIGAVAVSLVGNAADMALPLGQPVTGAWAAAVAVVAPVSLLASTHAVLLLVRQHRLAAGSVDEVAAVDYTARAVQTSSAAPVAAPAAVASEGRDQTGLAALIEQSAAVLDTEMSPTAATGEGGLDDGAESATVDLDSMIDSVVRGGEVDGQLELAVNGALKQAQMPGLDEVCGQLSASLRASSLDENAVRDILLEKSAPTRASDRALAQKHDVHPTTIGRLVTKAERLGWQAESVLEGSH